MDASKPPTIFGWNFAERNCDGVPILIAPTRMRNWQQFLTQVAPKCGCAGGVRAAYTPQGKEIKDLSQFTDGQDVVIVPSGVSFDKKNLPLKLAAKYPPGG
jgi:hypothetical protein